MTKEEFESIKEFAGRLAELRLQVADGQLLDRCQQALNDLVEHASLNFEDFPHELVSPPSHIEEEEPTRGLFEAREPEPPPIPPHLHREPGPPPPSEPEPEVRQHAAAHKTAHKRPTARKTHR